MSQPSSRPVLAHATFRMAPDDVAAGQRANLRWRLKQPRLYVFPIICAMLAIILDAAANPGLPAPDLLEVGASVLVIFVALYGATYVAIPLGARRVFRQQRNLQEEWQVELTSYGVRAFTPSQDGTIAWANYCAWSQDKKIILLYQSDRLFQMMPARAATPELLRVFHQFAGHLPRR